MPALPCKAMSARLYSQTFQTVPPGSEHETSFTRHGLVVLFTFPDRTPENAHKRAISTKKNVES